MKKEKQKDEHNLINSVKSPAHLQIIERRHFIRHPLSLPLTYKVIKSRTGKECSETINVSVGGLLFPAKRPVESNSMIAIKMPFEDKVFSIKAKVIRCVNNSETKFYDIAVTFFRLNEAFKAKMIEQIYLIAEYRDLLTLQSSKEVSLEEASRKWIKRDIQSASKGFTGRFLYTVLGFFAKLSQNHASKRPLHFPAFLFDLFLLKSYYI